MLLSIRDLRKTYSTPEGEELVVVDLPEFALDEREHVALAGSSGSGKTTLLHLIAGVLVPDSGSIEIGGTDVTKLTEGARDAFRARTIGYVFQQFHLLPGYTALENVVLGMSFGSGVNRRYAEDLLERLGLGDRKQYTPEQMSIGQRQRVAVARALANRPKLLLADEPTGNLDRENALVAMRLIREVAEERGAAMLVVSHDPAILETFERRHDLSELNRASGAAGGVA